MSVSEIGLGTEHLHGQPPELVSAVVREAVRRGVSYFDILWTYPDYLDNLGAALTGLRDRVTLAVHLGSAVTDGQYRLSRDPAECEPIFSDALTRLGTDHADIAIIQWVDMEEDFATVMKPAGMLALAQRIRDRGQARFIGASSHIVATCEKVVRSGLFDVLMFPVNPGFDRLPGDTSLQALHSEAVVSGAPAEQISPERKELYRLCATTGIGLVGMKPFAGGLFFQLSDAHKAGLTPAKLLNYALSQAGVATVVPGLKSTDQLTQALAFLTASPEDKDFGPALAASAWRMSGSCVYCNHCLPCPSQIDIGRTLRLLALAENGVTPELQAAYRLLPAKASACVECEACTERCPFGVDASRRIRKAAEVFES